jgi:ABC-type phosphate transport system ATPase subunit
MNACNYCSEDLVSGDRYCTKCGRQSSSLASEGEVTTQKALDVTDVRYRLGMVYYKKNQFSRAIQIWEKILEERPGDRDLDALIQDARRQQQESNR